MDRFRLLYLSAELGKNAVCTFRRCEVVSDKNRIFLSGNEYYSSILSQKFTSQFYLESLRISKKNIHTFFLKLIFFQRKVDDATSEWSYGVFFSVIYDKCKYSLEKKKLTIFHPSRLKIRHPRIHDTQMLDDIFLIFWIVFIRLSLVFFISKIIPEKLKMAFP